MKIKYVMIQEKKNTFKIRNSVKYKEFCIIAVVIEIIQRELKKVKLKGIVKIKPTIKQNIPKARYFNQKSPNK